MDAHLLHATAFNICHAVTKQFKTAACTPLTGAVTSVSIALDEVLGCTMATGSLPGVVHWEN